MTWDSCCRHEVDDDADWWSHGVSGVRKKGIGLRCGLRVGPVSGLWGRRGRERHGLATGWAYVTGVSPGGGGEVGHGCEPARERGKFEPRLLFQFPIPFFPRNLN